jgi:hypothetical protein
MGVLVDDGVGAVDDGFVAFRTGQTLLFDMFVMMS